METSSLLGSHKATDQHYSPCLHRIEDDHPSGLPFICTRDKGHDGEHSEVTQ